MGFADRSHCRCRDCHDHEVSRRILKNYQGSHIHNFKPRRPKGGQNTTHEPSPPLAMPALLTGFKPPPPRPQPQNNPEQVETTSGSPPSPEPPPHCDLPFGLGATPSVLGPIPEAVLNKTASIRFASYRSAFLPPSSSPSPQDKENHSPSIPVASCLKEEGLENSLSALWRFWGLMSIGVAYRAPRGWFLGCRPIPVQRARTVD